MIVLIMIGFMGLLISTLEIGNSKRNSGCVLTIAAFLQPIGFWVAYFSPGKMVCPYCQQNIPEKAIVCGYCKKELSTDLVMQKDKRDKIKNIVGVLGVIFTVMFLVGIIISQEKDQATKINMSTVPTATLSPHAALRVEIENVLGSSNRNVPRLTEISFDNPEKGAIFINWAIDDNITENLLKFGAKSDATQILKALDQSGIDYTYVILSGSFPMVDKFGNSHENNVVNLTFYKSTVKRINWQNFLSDNIYNIADEAHVYFAFQDK